MQPYDFYRRKQILEADPEDILLQLLEGAKIRLKQARQLWEEGQKITARERRQHALQIITTLDSTLDRESEAEAVEDLDALYSYMLREITDSTREEDFQRLANVESVLEDIHQGFQDAVSEYKESRKGAVSSAAEQERSNGSAAREIGAV